MRERISTGRKSSGVESSPGRASVGKDLVRSFYVACRCLYREPGGIRLSWAEFIFFAAKNPVRRNKKNRNGGVAVFLFRYALSFLVEEIHRPFGADRGERENRVAEVFESFGHRLALFVVPVPQYVVHLVSARESPPMPKRMRLYSSVPSSSVMFFSPLCRRRSPSCASGRFRTAGRCHRRRPADSHEESSPRRASSGRPCPKGSCRSRA